MARELLQGIVDEKSGTDHQLAEAEWILARMDSDEGNTSRAIVRLIAWMDRYPVHRRFNEVLFLLGVLYSESGAHIQAQETLYKAANASMIRVLTSEKSDYWSKAVVRASFFKLADTAYHKRDWSRAKELYKRFRGYDTTADVLYETTLYREADCFLQLGETDKAEQSYRRAVMVAPFHPFAPEAFLRLTFIYAKQGHKQAEEEALASLVWLVAETRPKEQEYWQRRAISGLADIYADDRQRIALLKNSVEHYKEKESWKSLYNHLVKLSGEKEATKTEKGNNQ